MNDANHRITVVDIQEHQVANSVCIRVSELICRFAQDAVVDYDFGKGFNVMHIVQFDRP